MKAVGGGGGEIPRGHKTRRAAASDGSFTRFPEVSDPHREKSPEGALRFRVTARSGGNAGRAAGLERDRRLCEGKKP